MKEVIKKMMKMMSFGRKGLRVRGKSRSKNLLCLTHSGFAFDLGFGLERKIFVFEGECRSCFGLVGKKKRRRKMKRR